MKNETNLMRPLEPESLPRRQTDPLWIENNILIAGHNETSPNATATFVKRKGRHYMVTCGHILRSVKEMCTEQGAKYSTMTLRIDKKVMPLPCFIPQESKPRVRSQEQESEALEVDIALAFIDGKRWHRLSSEKNKVAIDLDSWREPNWSDVTYCKAVGYENEGKKIISSDGVEKVETPFLNVVAELSSIVRNDTTEFTMFSKLPRSHDHLFSGMSGGTVYAVEGSEQREAQDEELFPVGIVFEGYPSTEQAINRNNEKAIDALLTQQDILIRAVKLTPNTFDDWLKRSRILESGFYDHITANGSGL